MKDFLIRVAERALGTAPRIDPQGASRYAPARLPLPEPIIDRPLAAGPRPARTMPSIEIESRSEPSEPAVVGPKERVVEDTVKLTPAVRPQIARSFSSPVEGTLTAREPESELESTPLTPAPTVRATLVEAQTSAIHPESEFFTEAPRVADGSLNLAASEPSHRDQNDYLPETEAPARNEMVSAEREIHGQVPQLQPAREVHAGTPLNAIAEPFESSTASPRQLASDHPAANDSPPRAHQPITRAPFPSDHDHPPAASLERRDNERPREEPEPGPRNIRVKIGRVEVHAAPPPLTPVEPTGPPPPKLSLAEFLRQHNGRRG
jgi:hypothetical protein